MYENTCRCGELELPFFAPSAGGLKKTPLISWRRVSVQRGKGMKGPLPGRESIQGVPSSLLRKVSRFEIRLRGRQEARTSREGR